MRIDLGVLRTRVARRILLFFLLCAVVPVSVLSLLSYFSVRNQLLTDAEERLGEASKIAGNALAERLQFLESRARLALTHGEVLDSEALIGEARIEDEFEGFEAGLFVSEGGESRLIFGVMPIPTALTPAEREHVQEGLALIRIVHGPEDGPEILMSLNVSHAGDQSGQLWTRLDQEFLWSTAAAYSGLTGNVGFCVLEGARIPLHCTLPDQEIMLRALPRDGGGETPGNRPQAHQSFEWADADGNNYLAAAREVFLRPAFFFPKLEIVVSESRSGALSAMETFQSNFWRVVLMGLAAVALLSNIQIRKSLDPLVALRKGTNRLAQGRFGERVSVSSNDEFEELADSFNTMAQDLESQFQALATIGEIDRAILSALDSDGILRTALLRVKDILSCELVAVCTLDWHGSREGRIRVFDVPKEKLTPEMKVRLSADDLGLIQEAGESRILDGDEVASQYFGVAPGTRGVAKAVLVPLQVPEGLAGFLAVGRLEPVEFSETDLDRVQQIGKQLSIALANAWLMEELDRLNWGALTALARTIDAKSPWTSGHSEHVATLSEAVGRGMGLPENTLTALQRGGLIHDIGKIAVPGSILDKRGELTPEEREIIETHPAEGVRILEPITALEPVLPMVLHHHEAWDGSGYPSGLSGEGIPLEARIMAVADQFDALSSDRPYRKGLGLEETVAFLRRQAGKTLDPEIVDVFLTLLKAGELPVQTPYFSEMET